MIVFFFVCEFIDLFVLFLFLEVI